MPVRPKMLEFVNGTSALTLAEALYDLVARISYNGREYDQNNEINRFIIHAVCDNRLVRQGGDGSYFFRVETEEEAKAVVRRYRRDWRLRCDYIILAHGFAVIDTVDD